jgi:predicted HTH domain antitoxin
MSDISLTIPGDALAAAKIPRHRLESELKKQLAIQLYREGLISGAGACRIAGRKTGQVRLWKDGKATV